MILGKASPEAMKYSQKLSPATKKKSCYEAHRLRWIPELAFKHLGPGSLCHLGTFFFIFYSELCNKCSWKTTCDNVTQRWNRGFPARKSVASCGVVQLVLIHLDGVEGGLQSVNMLRWADWTDGWQKVFGEIVSVMITIRFGDNCFWEGNLVLWLRYFMVVIFWC